MLSGPFDAMVLFLIHSTDDWASFVICVIMLVFMFVGPSCQASCRETRVMLASRVGHDREPVRVGAVDGSFQFGYS